MKCPIVLPQSTAKYAAMKTTHNGAPSQMDLFEADLGFVQIFRSLVLSGRLAEIGAYGLAVLLVIKVSASYTTGESHISMRKIKEQTGLSLQSVQKAIKLLEEKGFLAASHRGKSRRRNFYVVKEEIPFTSVETDEPAGVINFQHVPRKNAVVKKDIANFLKTGRTPAGSPIVIKIQNLNMGSEPVDVSLEDMSPQMRESFMRMIPGELIHAEALKK